MRATDNYLKTLLSYYEEEIEGEAYFYGLVDHFEEQAVSYTHLTLPTKA